MKQIPGGVTAPKGFRAWGVHCGVKSKKADKKDLALILSDQECAAAAVYTMNRVKAAPLYVTMEHLEDGTAWGVAANSGNANACCPLSHEYAEEMARLAARSILSQDEVVIDVHLHEGEHEATCWGCDLTYEYVKINGDYRT